MISSLITCPACQKTARRCNRLQRLALLQEAPLISGSAQALRPNHLPSSNGPIRQPTRTRPAGRLAPLRYEALMRSPTARASGINGRSDRAFRPDAHASRLPEAMLPNDLRYVDRCRFPSHFGLPDKRRDYEFSNHFSIPRCRRASANRKPCRCLFFPGCESPSLGCEVLPP